MDPENSQVYDENLNQEEIIDNNGDYDNHNDEEELIANENIINSDINENIDENINEKSNITDKDNSGNNENNILSQSVTFTSGSNFSNNKDEENSNKNDNLDESNSYQNENEYTRIVDIENEPVLKQLNNVKNENINEVSKLKGSKPNLYSISSNSKIAHSNHELYMNIVQKRYQLGDSSHEKKHRNPITEEIINIETKEEYQNDISSTSKESIHYHLQDPLTSKNFGKKEKIRYIESNIVNDEPVSISGMTYDELKKKSDRWLDSSYLNNEKYKKNHEVDMNNLSVQILAQEFLINENVDLETRAYLLESVFPLLCVSLEKLLVEIDRRKIIENDEEPSEFVVERSHNAVPRDVPFDSINWLAQYLYRNNPKYSNYSDITSTPYLKSIKSVTTTLQAKLFEMNINQKALERADELAKKREEERQQKIIEALYIEKKRTYTNLLKTLYKQWVKKLWRSENNPYLTNFEILDCLMSIESLYQSVKETDDMKGKLKKLVDNAINKFDNLIQIQIKEEKEEKRRRSEEIKLEEIIDLDDFQQEVIRDNNEMIAEIDINETINVENSNNENMDKQSSNENINDKSNDDINNNINDAINNEASKDIKSKESDNNIIDEENNHKNNQDNINNYENLNNEKTNSDNVNNENENKRSNEEKKEDTNIIDNKTVTESIKDMSNRVVHISQDEFAELFLNSIIEWKIEEVSLLISLINEHVKLEESEMNRIYQIICGLPGIMLLGNEWKIFIETNSEKLEMPQSFVDNPNEIVNQSESEGNKIAEMENENQNEEADSSEILKHKINEKIILALKGNIKIANDVCKIIVSNHHAKNLVKQNTEENDKMESNNLNNESDVKQESMDITPRFIKNVTDLMEYFKDETLINTSEKYLDEDYEENKGVSKFQLFIKNLISTYSPKVVLFILYQINCLKLLEIEEAKRQEIRRREEEILQRRIKKIKLIYNHEDKDGNGNVLVKQLNTIFENVPSSVGDMEFLKYPLEVQDMFVYLKIPVMARALLTKTITEQEFVDHFLNVCASLTPDHFDIVLQLILESLGINSENENKENEKGGEDENEELSVREKDQNEVLKMIWNLMKDPEADISQICDLGLTWTVDTIAKYNTTGQLVGDVVVNESVVDYTNSEDQDEKVSTQLVYISADNTGKESKENIDKQFSILNNPASSILEAFKSNKIKIVDCNESMSEDENTLKDSLMLNVPFYGKDVKSPVGVLSFKLKPNLKDNNEGTDVTKDSTLEFSKDDINFIKSVGKVLGYAIEHIAHRERSNAILESCSTYLLDLLKNSNVNLYLVEKVPSRSAIENIGKKKNKVSTYDDDSDSDQSFSNEDYTFVMYVSNKPTEEEKKNISKKNSKKKTTEKNSKNKEKFQKSEKDNVLKKVSKNDKNRNVLMESINTNTIVTRPDSESKEETVTTIPIVDQMNQCIGMISMNTKLAENDPSFIEDINELKRLATLIADAMALAEQENKNNAKPLLYAETISEQLRRKLFFPKLLLLKARENLSKIDAKSIAELKSYRVPPTIIHKIICCILYMFGYSPKQVESWQDTTKYINQDLLRRMQQYDSTAKQKSLIFKRIKSIIKKYIKIMILKNNHLFQPNACMIGY
ncbi:hypothetical protein LY90DRAFT_663896 [Neocallimastix californiae]|uniref:EF-hand domain-containing protein n=1 Tax=Neocallimastix californiae TaxID=1754190 RepID=A0A1Y2FFM4_9FUNG|nr:hypothetical protein LY90DRAFT_663896 [Neocallimastix californiae]|eukprot:ORY82721.1 hypothetical protein LY90DRAFT_663896 [Neocallimastix californiae]